MKISADLEEWDDFEERLIALAEMPGMAAELLQIGEDIRNRAIENLEDGRPPGSRSGRLAESLTVRQSPSGDAIEVGTPLKYGADLEFGTSVTSEYPWFGPAVSAATRGIGQRIRQVLAMTAKL